MSGIMKASSSIYQKPLISIFNFSQNKLYITLQFSNQSPQYPFHLDFPRCVAIDMHLRPV
jgi:hypothetical protein